MPRKSGCIAVTPRIFGARLTHGGVGISQDVSQRRLARDDTCPHRVLENTEVRWRRVSPG
ncbi:unnamed protein product, partial [Iphiclides podalirius]